MESKPRQRSIEAQPAVRTLGAQKPAIPTPVVRKPVVLIVFLRLVGGVSLLAFAAAVMPEKWIVEIAEFLGFDPFPYSPLTFYLARNLSLLYGFVGAALLIVSTDLQRYFPLIRYAAIGTIVFGVLQWIVDTQAGLPLWWSLGESLSTLIGGLLLLWIQRRTLIVDQSFVVQSSRISE